jgi:hypothetical protein
VGSPTELFFQLVFFLAGAFLSFYSQLLEKPQNRQLARVFGVLLIVLSVAWVFFEWGRRYADAPAQAGMTSETPFAIPTEAARTDTPAPAATQTERPPTGLPSVTPTRDPVILKSVSIGPGEALPILSNQVVLRVTDHFYLSASSSTNFINLDVTISNNIESHSGLRVGEQAFFEYGSRQYSITVLEINTSTATISIQEVLIPGN